MKKVAVAPREARMSSTWGVKRSSGPSSKVSANVPAKGTLRRGLIRRSKPDRAKSRTTSGLSGEVTLDERTVGVELRDAGELAGHLGEVEQATASVAREPLLDLRAEDQPPGAGDVAPGVAGAE